MMAQLSVNKGIVILGGGLSGLLTALFFANEGIKTSVFDSSNLKIEDPRTTAISKRSSQILEDFNLWHHFKDFISPIKDIHVADCNYKDVFTLSGDLGYMIENRDLRRILTSLARENQNIEIQTQKGYSDIDFDNVYFEDSHITPDLIILCDGFKSKGKKKLFRNKIDKSYNQQALVCNVRHTVPHDNTAIEHFYEEGPFAVLPLRNQYESAIVWTLRNKPEILDLKKMSMGYFGDMEIITTPVMYDLQAVITSEYFKGKVCLVSDTAHHIHPLAGQGLNMGIRDISSLVKIISKQNNLGIRRYELEEYQKERSFENYKMYLKTDSINFLFTHSSICMKILRRFGISIIKNSNFLKALITSQ